MQGWVFNIMFAAINQYYFKISDEVGIISRKYCGMGSLVYNDEFRAINMMSRTMDATTLTIQRIYKKIKTRKTLLTSDTVSLIMDNKDILCLLFSHKGG